MTLLLLKAYQIVDLFVTQIDVLTLSHIAWENSSGSDI